jgi:hypothetical protein
MIGLIGLIELIGGINLINQSTPSPGDGGDDHEGVVFGDGRFYPVAVANVFLVEVDIDEAAKLAVIIKMLAQVRVLASQVVERFANGGTGDRYLTVPTGIRPEWGWNTEIWHLFSPLV